MPFLHNAVPPTTLRVLGAAMLAAAPAVYFGVLAATGVRPRTFLRR